MGDDVPGTRAWLLPHDYDPTPTYLACWRRPAPLEAQTSTVQGVPWGTPPPSPLMPGHLIESKLMQCEQCDAGVALLIFADEATDHGGLEDGYPLKAGPFGVGHVR